MHLGNDINVCLAPLVVDLKLLWNDDVEIYDVYCQETFALKAMLLQTINDFPTYSDMYGCTIKGYYACSICREGTFSKPLKHSQKMSFACPKEIPIKASFLPETKNDI